MERWSFGQSVFLEKRLDEIGGMELIGARTDPKRGKQASAARPRVPESIDRHEENSGAAASGAAGFGANSLLSRKFTRGAAGQAVAVINFWIETLTGGFGFPGYCRSRRGRAWACHRQSG